MKKMPIELQRSVLEKIAVSKGVAVDEIDWDKLDSTLTFAENRKPIEEQINRYAENPNEILADKYDKEEHEAFEQKGRLLEEALSKKEFEKAVEAIKKTPTPSIDRYFATQIELIKAFYNSKDIHSLIFDGGAGLGKTTICFQTLSRDLNLEINRDFIIISGHLTPLELYHLLWKYQDQIILIDDIGDLLENIQSKSILISATWNPTGIRTVKWLSTSPRLEAPKEFNFKGKVIFCVNYLPDELEALKSRSFYCKFNFDFNTKLKIAYEIAKLKNIPFEMVDWIKTKQLYDFDFRLPTKLSNLGGNWKNIADEIMEIDERLATIEELMKTHKPVNEQIAEFIRRTGNARATFFNLRKQYFPDYKNR